MASRVLAVAVALAAVVLCVGPAQAAPAVYTERYASLSCDVCLFVAGRVQAFVKAKAPMNLIETIATDVCIFLKIEDKNVCSLVIPEFTHEIATVFEDVALSPAEICGLIGRCPAAPSPMHPWNVTLPNTPKPPLNPRTPPTPGSPVRRILFISDTHFDEQYTVGFNTQCGEPLCCRPPNGPGSGPTAAGKWGDYNCDTPLALLENALETAANMTPGFDFIIWPGDVPAHNVWNQSRADQIRAIQTSVATIRKYFPNTPVYPAVGNHEGVPVNAFPPPYVTGGDSDDWLLNTFADAWSTWLPADTIPTIKQGGFYTALIEEGLRIISLNMNYCNDENWWMLINETDPAGELHWLISTLQAAEDKGELVYIMGHIPPGSGSCLDNWSYNYNVIVDRYESTIIAQFFGHVHADEFEISYDLETGLRPTSMYFCGPSLTPYTEYNPAFRVFLADAGKTKLVLDSHTYVADLVRANKEGVPTWELEYSPLDSYGMKALQPVDWHDFAVRMSTDADLFNTYMTHFYKGYVNGRTCDDNCRKNTLCGLRASKTTKCFLDVSEEEHRAWAKARPKSC